MDYKFGLPVEIIFKCGAVKNINKVIKDNNFKKGILISSERFIKSEYGYEIIQLLNEYIENTRYAQSNLVSKIAESENPYYKYAPKIGHKVIHNMTNKKGKIIFLKKENMQVEYEDGSIINYIYPDVFLEHTLTLLTDK